ncbi:MAG: hypothetical protein JOZ46_09030 [Candidatus Dormibacteraeota bacterium]|nr:hypothetical protein [Candidatus Dormibacteraeota bacterium]MBV9525940.1 hypothetical protein [Candidatus Dormibacteraeota bacterium]
MAEQPPDAGRIDADAERLIARALESVLQTVPEVPGGDVTAPEQSPTAQPWAETAAPPGRDKRPLEDLVAEFAGRVAAAPGARAGRPAEQHPAEAYLESLSAAPSSQGKRGNRRRWRGGRRRGGSRRRGRGGGGGTGSQ